MYETETFDAPNVTVYENKDNKLEVIYSNPGMSSGLNEKLRPMFLTIYNKSKIVLEYKERD